MTVTEVDEPKVQEIESDDDKAPDLVDAAPNDLHKVEAEETDGRSKKGEKKNRKAIQRIGLTPVPDIKRVVISAAGPKDKTPGQRNLTLVINSPDVYKLPGSDQYVVFGEAKIEDHATRVNAETAAKFAQAAQQGIPPPPQSKVGAAAPAGGSEDEPDASGLSETDIELVMAQASVDRATAIKALKECDVPDALEAILALTNMGEGTG